MGFTSGLPKNVLLCGRNNFREAPLKLYTTCVHSLVLTSFVAPSTKGQAVGAKSLSFPPTPLKCASKIRGLNKIVATQTVVRTANSLSGATSYVWGREGGQGRGVQRTA